MKKTGQRRPMISGARPQGGSSGQRKKARWNGQEDIQTQTCHNRQRYCGLLRPGDPIGRPRVKPGPKGQEWQDDQQQDESRQDRLA